MLPNLKGSKHRDNIMETEKKKKRNITVKGNLALMTESKKKFLSSAAQAPYTTGKLFIINKVPQVYLDLFLPRSIQL